MSKLATLAAARKKRESEKNNASGEPKEAFSSSPAQPDEEQRSTSVSLLDRLSGSGKTHETRAPRLPLRRADRKAVNTPQEASPPTIRETAKPEQKQEVLLPKEGTPATRPASDTPSVDLRAQPSTFATVITERRNSQPAPKQIHGSRKMDIFKALGQNLTELFNFTEPSPDDVVLKAQSAAKGGLHLSLSMICCV